MSETEYALGTYCGVTFAGIKAASLFQLKRDCFKCLPSYEKHFSGRGFCFVCLKQYADKKLMYIYNRDKLEKILFDKANKRFLEGEGYSFETVEQAVEQLKQRMNGDEFPHEIGVFLDYPLEDVMGFITHPNDGVKLVGYWKVYADEEQKRCTFARYDKCTQKIRQMLMGGKPLEVIFNKT